MGADRIDAAFAVYLVNRNRAEVLYEQIRIDPVVGKISYLRSVHPQLHPAYRPAFALRRRRL